MAEGPHRNRSADKLVMPADVHASLVDSLFGEARSMFIGSAAASFGAALTAYKTGEWLLYICAALIVLVTALRALLIRAYRHRRTGPMTTSDVRRWEVIYAVGASFYVALLGLFCFVTLSQTDDPFAHLISFGTVIAYLIGVSGRNYASNTLIASQIACAGLPVVAGLFWMGGYYLAIIPLLLLPLMLAMKFISSGLRNTLLKAVIGERNMSVLAARFDTALNNMPHGLGMFDAGGALVVRNSRLVDLLRLSPEHLAEGTRADTIAEACTAAGLVAGDQAGALREALYFDPREPAGELFLDTSDGRTLSVAVQPMETGGWVSIVQDITERRAAERKINQLATFDTLTGLANRYALRREMEELTVRPGRGTTYAVLFVDLDHFKQVNDTLGHQFGDALLCQVAIRLREIAGRRLSIARFGGDEFVILLPGGDASEAALLAKQVIQRLSVPYEIDRHKIIIGASIGIAVSAGLASDPDQLLRDADTALYEVKNQGRGHWCFFRPEMAVKALTRRTLELALRTAVENNAFQLAFQPLYDVGAGRYSTCEALLRWTHGERGPISPTEFIPIAEETGLIVPIGRWVLNEACRVCTTWPDDVKVAVNLSPVQFRHDDVAATVAEALTISGLNPARLEVEITETALLKEEASTIAALERIRGLGVNISLDDFGTGYSSLSYLRSFHFNKVKIDRSFISELATDTSSRILLRGIARLCSELGMRVAVEGVETDEQMHLLAGFPGIGEIQGYFFSRPLNAEKIRPLLIAERASATLANAS